jgi:hypothetical protein
MKHAVIVLRGTWPISNPRDPNLEEMNDSTLLPTVSTQEDEDEEVVFMTMMTAAVFVPSPY